MNLEIATSEKDVPTEEPSFSARARSVAFMATTTLLLAGSLAFLIWPMIRPQPSNASLSVPRASSVLVERATTNALRVASADKGDATTKRDTTAAFTATAKKLSGNAKSAGPAIPPPAPTRIRISSIDVDAPIVPVGLDEDRSLVVPSDGDEVGWWSQVDRNQPTVLVGHVDTDKREAVFYHLAKLTIGDEISIKRSARDETFRVSRIVRVNKDDFPTRAVYREGRGLRVITCGGAFDRKTKHYEDNVIVFAEPA
jgi:LPXTG-site transpeptidase (sortase) family protein